MEVLCLVKHMKKFVILHFEVILLQCLLLVPDPLKVGVGQPREVLFLIKHLLMVN